MNGLTHVHILIIKKPWKKSLICSNTNGGSKIVICVLISFGKCKMQLTYNHIIKYTCNHVIAMHLQCGCNDD
jgi:hypothetical protein